MKIHELARGAICRVPGIDLELEVLDHQPSSTCVRPTGRHVVAWRGDDGEEVRFSTRSKPFSIASSTEVELIK